MRRLPSSAFVCLLLLSTGSLHAQDLLIEATDPIEGQTGVPLHHVVTFRLNSPLPPLGATFATRFTWSPTEATTLTRFGHDRDADGNLTVVFFTLDHAPDTDYAFFVYGLKAEDGSTMTRPFTLNYTTASEMGPYTVRGNATFRERTFTSLAVRSSRLRALLRQVVASPPTRTHAQQAAARPSAVSLTPPAHPPAPRAERDLNRTVLLLLDAHELSPRAWRIRAAAAIRADGSFSFDHVRPGTYWPLALNWRDAEGTTIEAYGFVDADGDLEPDSVVVGPQDVEDLAVSLFPVAPTTALPALALARERVAALAPDQRLLEIGAGEEATGGLAARWHFLFYAPSRDALTLVEVDPLQVLVEAAPGEDDSPAPVTERIRTRQSLPDALIDSHTAFEIAEAGGGAAYRAGFDDPAGVSVTMRAGDLDLPRRPPPGEVFWKVTYHPPVDGFEPLTLFVDAETGAVLAPVAVATEPAPEVPPPFALHPNYPNPFGPSTRITFDVHRAGPLRLVVYDVLGRRVRTLVEAHTPAGSHVVAWDGRTDAGEPAAGGLYVYRLETAGFTATRLMTRLGSSPR